MPNPNGRGSADAFLDASVLVAAVLSSAGGSFRLCRESHQGRIRLHTNRYASNEVRAVLRRKRPDALPRLGKLTRWAGIRIQPDPPPRLVERYLPVINADDAPILAGAFSAGADFLITLDRDFFTERLGSANLPLTIVTPQEFFQQHWN